MNPDAAPGVRSDSVYSEIAIVEMGSWREWSTCLKRFVKKKQHTIHAMW